MNVASVPVGEIKGFNFSVAVTLDMICAIKTIGAVRTSLVGSNRKRPVIGKHLSGKFTKLIEATFKGGTGSGLHKLIDLGSSITQSSTSHIGSLWMRKRGHGCWS